MLLRKSSKQKAGIAELDIEDTNGKMSNQEKMMQHINQIKIMRKSANAPVDTMGCHTCADRNAEPKIQRFQTLVALLLSSQTKDQVTSSAMERLKNMGCTIQNLTELPEEELAELLKPVGFYKRKAKYLKQLCAILREKYDQDIPDTYEGLCSLPGVGPKMANLTIQIAFNRVEGIGVDTHVHRISNRLKWVNTTTPEETEFKLREILPKSEWNSINQLLVGFGQTICLPVNPKCSKCLNKEFCPWNGRKRSHHE